ncbi:MAG: acyltransferase [Leadbetterella sp.]|nr:acyltransferase [Leadbetterella sp.]
MNKELSRKFTVISFLSMILVVVLHSNNMVINLSSGSIIVPKGYNSFIQDFFTQGIARTAVPLFFIISGYLYFLNIKGTRSEFKVKISKRTKTILIPYLVWSSWGLLFYTVLQFLPMSQNFFTNGLIKDMRMEEILKILFLNPLPFQLWFLRDLMILVVFSPLLFFTIKYLREFAVFLAFIPWISGYFYGFINTDSLLFFMFGGYLAIFDKLISFDGKKYAHLLFSFWILLVIINSIFLFQGISIFDFWMSVLNKITLLVGVVAIWTIYDKLRGKINIAVLNPIFSYSFFLYAFHEPVLTMAKKGLFFILGNSQHVSFSVYILAPFLTIVLSLYIGFLAKKYIPKIYDIATGGR